MKDRAQKSSALEYAVAKRWFPQVELDVSTYITIAKTPTVITDVDVYASMPDDFAGFRTLLIDCKTRKGESPIARAMWLRGLMDRMEAEQGICLLRTPRIEEDHRYTGAHLGVSIIAETEFPAFVKATAPTLHVRPAIAEMDAWDKYFAIPSRFPALEPAIAFSRSGFWMSETEAEACIRTIFLTHAMRPELDPERPEHIAVVADLVALFAHAMARVVVRIFAAYLQPGKQEDLSRALLFFLYGGRSSYDHLNRIRRLIVEGRANESTETVVARPAPPAQLGLMDEGQVRPDTAGPEVGTNATSAELLDGTGAETASRKHQKEPRDLTPPEWDKFVELTRQMLDAPLEVSRSPLLLREIGWAALNAGTSGADGITDFARVLARESPQAARFAVLALDYLCKAGRLPREFQEVITSRLLTAQSRP